MGSESPKLYDVFLSHRGEDKAAVEHIAGRLIDEAKLQPFLDKWHLVPGTPLQEELEVALQNSTSCAIFIGPSGLSPWENEEARVVLESRIRNQEIRVIPVLLPGAREETINALPPLLRRFLWVDFRSGLTELDPLERLVAGVIGKPPGRKSSGSLSKESFFVKKSTSELLKSFSKLDLTELQLDTNIPLDTFAKIAQIHNPNLDFAEIKIDLSQARSKIYDEKYSERLSNEDERYIDFNGWQTKLRKLLY